MLMQARYARIATVVIYRGGFSNGVKRMLNSDGIARLRPCLSLIAYRISTFGPMVVPERSRVISSNSVDETPFEGRRISFQAPLIGASSESPSL